MIRPLIVILTILSIPLAYAFEISSWPYEGMPYFRVLTDTLILHEEPSSQSPHAARVSIEKGSFISFPYGVRNLISYARDGKVSGVPNEESINTDIMLDKSLQRTTSPGIIKAVADGKFDASTYGKVNTLVDSKIESKEKTFYFTKGDIIEKLSYLGEGVCLFRFGGEVFSHHGCLYWNLEKYRTLVRESEPVTEWWISFKKNGKPLGWLRVDNENNQIEMVETRK